jgi:hypothetical protein
MACAPSPDLARYVALTLGTHRSRGPVTVASSGLRRIGEVPQQCRLGARLRRRRQGARLTPICRVEIGAFGVPGIRPPPPSKSQVRAVPTGRALLFPGSHPYLSLRPDVKLRCETPVHAFTVSLKSSPARLESNSKRPPRSPPTTIQRSDRPFPSCRRSGLGVAGYGPRPRIDQVLPPSAV